MSYNVNNLIQHPPNTNNQQLQPVTQQASSGQPIPGGNYQQSQQSYNWTDGNLQGHHHQSTQSWSWQGQTAGPTNQLPPILATPPMLMQNTSHQQLHQQMHQSALNHHQQALALHQQVANMMHQNVPSLMGNMVPTIQQAPRQAQIAYETALPQPQNAYQQGVAQQPQFQPRTIQQTPQQLQITDQTPLLQPQTTYQQGSVQQPHRQPQIIHQSRSASTPQFQTPELQYHQTIYQQPTSTSQTSPTHRPPTIQSPQQEAPQSGLLHPQQPQSPNSEWPSQGQQVPEQTDHDERFREFEKQRQKDVQDMNRAGADISRRLRDLEQTNTRAKSDREAKDREVHRLQEQLAANESQRRQDAERHNRQLAELVRSQAASPLIQTPAFDMCALQKVIRETQAQQLSAQDIEKVIEEQVSKRLAGMATKADIQSAGMTMQNALSRVPAGLSEAQVQQAVNRELNSVMQNVADRVNRQRAIADQRQQNLQTRQTPQDRVTREVIVEEFEEDVTQEQPQIAGNNIQSQRALPPANFQVTRSIAAARPATPPPPDCTVNQSSSTSQYPAIEASPLRRPSLASPQPQISTIPRVNDTTPAAPAPATVPPQPPLAALEAPPVHHPPSETSLTRVGPSGSRSSLFVDTSQQHNQTLRIQSNAPQRQLEAALIPAQDLSVARTQTTAPRVQGQAQYAVPPGQVEAVPTQRQLETGPAPVQDLSIARKQTTAPPFQGQAQLTMPPRQLEAVPTRRHLEAAPFAPTTYPSTGQELVHQSRDVSRRT